MARFSKVNEKLLQIDLNNEEIFSKKGAMIAYQGEVTFMGAMLAGGRISDMARRQATGEGLSLMKTKGRGLVLYAHKGKHVNIVSLQGDTLFVESQDVLAFDSRMRPGTFFLGNQRGGSQPGHRPGGMMGSAMQGLAQGQMTGQGLFTTTFVGMGDVAILSSGELIELQVSMNNPVYVDPQAYVAHKGQLQPEIHTDLSWRSLLPGQGTGESFQLKFVGQGTVYVQPDER